MRSRSRTDSHFEWNTIRLHTACRVEAGPRPPCVPRHRLPALAHEWRLTTRSYERLPSPGRINTTFTAVWTPQVIPAGSFAHTPMIYCSTREELCKFDRDGDGRYE